MKVGSLVGDRFLVEAVAGSGGMGTVFRAKDRLGDGKVALKVLHRADGVAAARFAREAEVLATLRHPAIVRYVAHGVAAGVPYLAMQWLEGESLTSRLARTGLSLREALVLGQKVASALEAAHARGVIHRDIKPSNLFLEDGEAERVKVLDFGIARQGGDRDKLTMTGAVLGTPGYLAPEQARGDRELDARTDLFALGAVLYECVTGTGPFVAEDIMAALLKVVLEEVRPPSELRSSVPPALDALLLRMLAKERVERPQSAAAVEQELASIEISGSDAPVHSARSARALTGSEQRVMSLVIGAWAPRALQGLDAAIDPPPAPRLTTLAEAVAEHQGTLSVLADDTVLVTLTDAPAATDLASRSALCALALRSKAPALELAIVTGRGDATASEPTAGLAERGARLVRSESAGAIRLDDVTAGLLDQRFETDRDARGLFLRGERPADTGRTLLGKATPTVGRDRELALLTSLFDECVAEPLAYAVVITGAAGIGKSRLRNELLRRIRARGPEVEIWIGRGEAMSAGSPFAILAQAIRRAAGLLGGESDALRRQKVDALVRRHVEPEDARRVAEFVGEMVGAPFPGDASQELRAARQSPALMGDQMRRAFVDLVRAECRSRPLVLALEDLHWGDRPSVDFVNAALGELENKPLLVLALARPEVDDAFPDLWSERRVQPMRLGDLTRRASEDLARRALGASADDTVIARIASQAGGNAFYLEELIRAVAEGRGDDLPETVLAMVQSRLSRLPAEDRRVLRAASIFGQVFWRDGVRALLGGPSCDEAALALRLDDLVSGELIARRREAKLSEQVELAFRHVLVRDAAYAMLTERDRAVGHLLAATWLTQAGETDARVLAEHFERGGEPESAVRFWARGAEVALEGNDLDAALVLTDRGVACGASGPARGELLFLRGEALGWRGELARVEVCAEEAMSCLADGAPRWYGAAGQMAEASGKLGHHDRLSKLAEQLLGAGREEMLPEEAIALVRTAAQLLLAGRPNVAAPLMDRLDALGAPLEESDPAIAGWINHARSIRALFAGDLGEYARLKAEVVRAFEQVGDQRNACSQRGKLGYALREVGLHGPAVAELRRTLEAAKRMNLGQVIAAAKHNLGLALAYQGALEEGAAVEREAIEAFRAQRDARLEAASHMYLSMILLRMGDVEGALSAADAGALLAAPSSPAMVHSLTVLASVRLASGAPAEALAIIQRAMDLYLRIGGADEGEAMLRLVHAEALAATGDLAASRSALDVAVDRIRARAERIRDPEQRASFLRDLPENARTLELWADGGAPGSPA